MFQLSHLVARVMGDTTLDTALHDWNAGQDFVNVTAGLPGTYVSKRDVETYLPRCVSVEIRSNSDRDFVVLRRKTEWVQESD